MKERERRARSDKGQTWALYCAPHTATRVVFPKSKYNPTLSRFRHFNAIFVEMWSVANTQQKPLGGGCLQRQTSRPTLEIVNYILEESLFLEWIRKGKIRGKPEGEGRNGSAAPCQ